MAIDPLATWRSTLTALPKVADTSWAANFAAWYAGRIVAITTASASLVPTGFLFTFNQALFASSLIAMTPTTNALAGIQGFANAWEAAVLATTVLCLPGTFKPPSTPATLFSVVASTVIDPVSIAAGKAKLLELVSSPPVADANDSEFPVKFREATLLLKITVSGTNSVSPTPGPLVVPAVPLI